MSGAGDPFTFGIAAIAGFSLAMASSGSTVLATLATQSTRRYGSVVKIPHVLADPAPSVEILTFNPMGTVIAVRPFCHTDHYWQVYFDTNTAIADVGAEAGYPAPETRHLLRNS